MARHGDSDALRGYSFLKVFADDHTIDSGELAELKKIALRDGVIDEDEKHTLHNIFSRVTQDQVDPDVWQEIQQFKAKHGID